MPSEILQNGEKRRKLISKRSIYWGIGIGIICIGIFCWRIWPVKQGEPELRLSLQKLEPNAKEIIIQLMVTNIGKYRLIIPRVDENMFRQYLRINGWFYRVHGTKRYGQFLYEKKNKLTMNDLAYKTSTKSLRWNDLIFLDPGEHVAIVFNIAEMKWASPFSEDYRQPLPELAEVNEEYEMTMEFGLDDDLVPFFLHKLVWQEWKESNTLRFTIEQPGKD